ncbi:hypothetical protein NXY56_001607 [Leishmania guyanensis]|uniref:Uncharacterized protein n=1 Tax=Leishmania guyanensis TaxID=5670 RepID=A0A1E1J916_LEIGU|nr:hypothetical protein, unknown function [Leishmania guyanensis]
MAVQLDGAVAPHHMDGARRRRPTTLSVAMLLLVLLSYGVEYVQGFAYVPVVTTFVRPDRSGDKMESRLLCQEGGGYIAGEPTAALHTAVIQAARGAGAATEWYAYLAASTNANPLINCPPPLVDHVIGSGAGASFGCYWRWNQGRWSEMDDNPDLPLYISHVGVTFYAGNYFLEPLSPSVSVYGVQGGFPSWFNKTEPLKSQLRPSAMFGQDLLAVGNGDASTWSDNKASGGYSYAGFSFSAIYNSSKWNADAQKASQANFWAVCQAQGSSRMMYEQQDTSSKLQSLWWVVFFVALLVLCFVVFVLAACCQDNENMDEPPEDAPEWAQEETKQVTHTKSFVSTRSFTQQHNCHSSDDDMSVRNPGEACQQNQSNMYGANHNTANQLPYNQYPNPLSSQNGAYNQGMNNQYNDHSRVTNNWM